MRGVGGGHSLGGREGGWVGASVVTARVVHAATPNPHHEPLREGVQQACAGTRAEEEAAHASETPEKSVGHGGHRAAGVVRAFPPAQESQEGPDARRQVPADRAPKQDVAAAHVGHHGEPVTHHGQPPNKGSAH